MSFYPVRAPRSRSTPGQPRILAPLFSHSDHLTRCASTQTSPLTASAYLCDTYLSSHPVHRLRTSPLNPIPSPSLHLLTTSIASKLDQMGTVPPQHTHAHPSSAGQPWNVPEPRETLFSNPSFHSPLLLLLLKKNSSPPAPPRSRTTTPPRFRDAHLFLIGWRRL